MGRGANSRENLAPVGRGGGRGSGRGSRGGFSFSSGGRSMPGDNLANQSVQPPLEGYRGRGRGRGGGGANSRENLASTPNLSLPMGVFDDDDDVDDDDDEDAADDDGHNHDNDDLDMESSQGVRGSNASEQASTPAFPSQRPVLAVLGKQFCSNAPVRQITENLKAMFGGPWISWKCIPRDARDRLWERFKQFFQWPSDLDESVREAWKVSMQARLRDTLNKERGYAIEAATIAGINVGDDMSVLIPYKPSWINREYWVQMIEKWNSDNWKAMSKANTKNKKKQVEGSMGKHTSGSISFLVSKLNMEKKIGRPLRYSEHFLNVHITKRSREAMAAGTGEPEFVTPKAQRLLEEYVKRMSDAYGSDVTSQPLGDVHIWEDVVGGKKKGRLEGCGGTSDPSYLVTGATSSSTIGPSSLTSTVTSSHEVNELQQQMLDAITKQEQLQKEMEEMRAREEAARVREQEALAREEAARAREEAAQKRFEDLQEMLLSRLGLPPPPPV